ncbi:uncharacterized protein LOC6560855 [Drosophila grimshawi]|uniref:GH20484 n=1 Tax=Drosophila grimshawi TaxID=7222 RepID=B4J930_DROGR|nr:uncharacterized protein LOC6560855 [Drosophila grimshawi]EDW01379.1 GH20484 [Drosophila grimshawi]
MSGKLIMKRKRAERQQELANESTAEKRHRLELEARSDTPPEESNSSNSPSIIQNAAAAPNSILLEALQKIMELQSELDSFEHDLDEREASELNSDDEDEVDLNAEVAAVNFSPNPRPPSTPGRRTEAEALGFAMCARETLLFLQSEGISTESVLYKALLGKLVGQSDGLLQA